MNPRAASALFQRLDRELWVVTARAGDGCGGLIATFVSSASIVPEMPRMLVGVARMHHTWGLIEASGALALHLIGEDRLDWVWRFGLCSGRDVDKLDGLETRPGPSGAPILAAAAGWLDCRVESRMDTGARTVYLAEVLDAQEPDARPILTVSRLRQLIPDDRRRELEAQMARDIGIEAEAIARWRRATRDGRG
jgi:flavin reductase (DIM6/NTAB) family NADH-FMN oxidoreductase RutF